MMFEYKQTERCEDPVNPEQCKASIMTGFHSHQCSRKKWKGGWCKQHHPETIKKRDQKADEEYEKERYNSTQGQLERMTRERDDLRKSMRDIHGKIASYMSWGQLIAEIDQIVRTALHREEEE